MNPCPCGAEGGPGSCRCRDAAKERYATRVSGPLLDRFDLRIFVDRPDVGDLMARAPDHPAGESSAVVAARVAAARQRAVARGVASNSDVPGHRLDELVPLCPDAAGLLETKLRQGQLSARGLHRVRRVARTLADLAGWDGPVRADDVYAALALRAPVFGPDRSAWEDEPGRGAA
jgi:magnesium chelatase family protein